MIESFASILYYAIIYILVYIIPLGLMAWPLFVIVIIIEIIGILTGKLDSDHFQKENPRLNLIIFFWLTIIFIIYFILWHYEILSEDLLYG
jgi:hypothetical protein